MHLILCTVEGGHHVIIYIKFYKVFPDSVDGRCCWQKCSWRFVADKVKMKWEPVPLHYMHTQTSTALELMIDQVSVLNILLSQL